MNNNIKISVIIPIYSVDIYIKQCIESLTNQTLEDIEIICVYNEDDAAIFELLKNYEQKDKRIKLLPEKNEGLSQSRNNGMKIAQGKYIGFLDSDDWADINMFEKLYINAEKFQSDISMCSIAIADEINRCTNFHDTYMTLDLFSEKFENRKFDYSETLEFIFRICVVAWNKIYKNTFLKEYNFQFEKNLRYEDNIFFLDTYTSAKNISIVKEPLVFYRKTLQNSVNSKDDKLKMDFFRIFQIEEKILKRKNIYDKLENYFKTYKKNTLIYWYKKITDKKIKEEYLNEFKKLYQEEIFT